MQLDEYQKEVLRTALRKDSMPPELAKFLDVLTFGLGLAGEAGEVADLLKKGLGHGHGVDAEKLTKELGDVLWYVAALANTFGVNLETVAQANVDKLKARYPDGFTVEASKKKADERINPVNFGGSDNSPFHGAF